MTTNKEIGTCTLIKQWNLSRYVIPSDINN